MEGIKIVQNYKNGATISDLMKQYHKGYYEIVKILDQYKIPHNRKTKKAMEQQEFFSKKDQVISYYLQGNSLNKCAHKFKVYVRDIKKLLNENNIHIRSYQEILQKRERDENFFKKETHEMAWLLGFLAADGSLSKKNNSITIQLAKKDEEILHKIRFLIGINNNITEYTNKDGYDVVSYRWSSKEHRKDLAAYGIIPNKTFLLKPPYKLSKQFHLDYIRGYFDGDGSINLIQNSNKRGNGNLRWQVCAATPEILEFILNTFEEYNIPKVNIQKRDRMNPLYIISYSSAATRKIYKILYNDSFMYLERKKDHYEEILNKVDTL